MKAILFLLFLLFINSCKEDDRYKDQFLNLTLEEIENDPNWKEIKDFELLEIKHLKEYELEEIYYFQKDKDYQLLNNYFYSGLSCTFNSLPEVDFNNNDVIGVSFTDYALNPNLNDEILMKLFYNNKANTILTYFEINYYLDSNTSGRNELGHIFRKWIKLEKGQTINDIKIIHKSNLIN